MTARRITGVLAGALLVALPMTAAAGTASAAVAPHAVTTVYYDDSAATGWTANVTAAIANWNAAEQNVQFAPADADHSATVTLEASSGWPETYPESPGAGTVELGQQAVDEGYDKTRITAHELGHILGLPDNYNGDCGLLMSGHSAGTSCTNANPSADEAAQVDSTFAGGSTASLAPRWYADRAAF